METLHFIQQFPKLSPILGRQDIRQWMNYVIVYRDYIIATDAHMLVRHKTSTFFEAETIEQIPDDGWKLDRWAVKDLERSSPKDYSFDPDKNLLYITFGRTKKKVRYTVQHPELQFETIPDVRHTAQEFIDLKPKPVPCIAVNAKLLGIVHEAMGAASVNLHFAGETKAIVLTPNRSDFKDAIGIVMPVEKKSV